MDRLFRNQEGMQVGVLTETQQVERLLAVFADVAAEQGWQPGAYLQQRPATARYIAAQAGNEVVGGFQVVLPDAEGRWAFQSVWPEVTLETAPRTAHIAILAIQPQYRGSVRLFWSLCAECWRFCVGQGIEALTLEVTPLMLRRYCRLGWPLEVIGDLRLHWGEDCYLCQVDLRSVAGSMLMRCVRSPIYRPLVYQASRPLEQASCPALLTLP